ncbi:hypothetical protein BP5796_05587 [Coleophoma crateriformis]|uniref:Uncharacterized protein n=1 Tax=Coleophoma crateriformis TaxID=565419 RepID=A0A3D8S3M3_9HELO|nr:hypothetical protein BP5796_05587 [Coleophoma crateriformis]
MVEENGNDETVKRSRVYQIRPSVRWICPAEKKGTEAATRRCIVASSSHSQGQPQLDGNEPDLHALFTRFGDTVTGTSPSGAGLGLTF